MTNQRKAVAFVIYHEGKILMGRKRSDSRKKLAGQWHVLGEKVEEKETDEEAIIRGAREESGLEVKVGNYLFSSRSPTGGREVRWYECFSGTGEVFPSGDVDCLKWVSKEKVKDYLSTEYVSGLPKEIKEYFGISP